MSLLILLAALFLSVVVGVYASRGGRSGLLWFIVSVLISPILSFFILLILGKKNGHLRICKMSHK
ncbi:hypothetical protein CI610_01135 [invertebrate metagenome]|uniref:Uncharacterized protein n=1 Tax=invertebrate metagenome TaxID=1711999 RepID=A0A2H9T9H9_9ZZZZ